MLGPNVQAFEAEFAAYLGVRHVIGVANGTDAITIALRALGVKPGDDVVVPSLTFYASAEAVVNAGARPVFCDVDFDTRNVTADTVRAALTPRTSAIVSVDLFGLPGARPARAGGARARGRRPGRRRTPQRAMAGALGDAATFSFYPSKNLGAFGDGGAMRHRRRRGRGAGPARCASTARATSRRSSTSATTRAWTRSRRRSCASCCPHLDGWCDGRRAAAAAYAAAGRGRARRAARVPDGGDPAWHLYVVTHPRADEVMAALNAAGVQARGLLPRARCTASRRWRPYVEASRPHPPAPGDR